jgi:hypothetical protein
MHFKTTVLCISEEEKRRAEKNLRQNSKNGEKLKNKKNKGES